MFGHVQVVEKFNECSKTRNKDYIFVTLLPVSPTRPR